MAIEYYKIVDSDSFGGDYPDEAFLGAQNKDGKFWVMQFRKDEAERIATALNDQFKAWDGKQPRYWRVVPEDYQLQGPFEP